MFKTVTDQELTIARHYRHAVVRDLAWVISSPPLLELSTGNIHWPDANWYRERYTDSADLLARLDQQPDELWQFLQHNRHRRLGAYFELLWIFWLQHQQRFRLLQHNLQIRDGQRTVGEFDLIVHDTVLEQTLHWEVAVKFYLGLADTRVLKNWVGPGLQDRFDSKLDRLLQHQTMLSAHPASQQTLQDYAIDIDATAVLLKGRLFYPIAETDNDWPEHASRDHLQAWWCDSETFSNTIGPSSPHWYVLLKHEWLAPVTVLQRPIASVADILAQVKERNEPLCVVALDANEEISRGFVVPPDWATRALT